MRKNAGDRRGCHGEQSARGLTPQRGRAVEDVTWSSKHVQRYGGENVVGFMN